MTNQISEQDIHALARQLAPKFTLDKFKSLLIENKLVTSRVFDEPFGRFSKIVIKEEYIREILFYLGNEKLYDLVDLLEKERKLPKDFKHFSSLAKSEKSIVLPLRSDTEAQKLNASVDMFSSSAELPNEFTSDLGYVFISYSHKDKEYVHKLQELLQKEGFVVWIDDRIGYGAEWATEIEKRLDESKAFILVASDNAKKSNWVQNEVRRAERLGKPIFPLLLQGEPWLYIERLQWFEVKDKSLPDEKFFKGLEKFIFRSKNLQGSNSTEVKKIENKKLYLQRIRSEIMRMHTKSNNMKVLITITSISFAVLGSTNNLSFLIALFPIISIWGFDTYYLQNERKLLGLQFDVENTPHNTLKITPDEMPVDIYKSGKYSFYNVFLSRTLFSHYPLVIMVFIVLYYFL